MNSVRSRSVRIQEPSTVFLSRRPIAGFTCAIYRFCRLCGSRRVHRRGSNNPHSHFLLIKCSSRLHHGEQSRPRTIPRRSDDVQNRPLDAGNVSSSGHDKQALALCSGPRGWPSVQHARLGSGCGLQRETNWQQNGGTLACHSCKGRPNGSGGGPDRGRNRGIVGRLRRPLTSTTPRRPRTQSK